MARDIKHLKADLNKLLDSLIDDDFLQMCADKMKDIIYKRTKSGKGLSGNSDEMGAESLDDLDGLSQGYKDYRKTKSLGPYGSPNKSNLTFTGEMLESIKAYVKGKDAIVEIPNTTRSDGQTNKKIAKKVSEAGRPFFNLADSELKQFEAFVSRELRKRIRELNK
jgi:hypothetical protein